jgi:hypothetical protein
LSLLALAPAAAQNDDPAVALYKAGDYAAAIKAGTGENSEAGLAIAARAALAEESLRDHPCLECLKRAEGYARRAIAAGGRLPETYFYLAAALGRQSRIIGVIRAKLYGYPEEAKRALDAALRLNANFSWVLAALGGWNIEVVRSGGAWLGDMVYGARFDQGVSYFHRAVAADPGNLLIHYEFAIALAAYDLDGERATVTREFAAAAAGTPASAFDKAIKARAANLKQMLDAGRSDDVAALVHKYQGYP